MKNIFISLLFYGLAIVLYSNLINSYDYDNGASGMPVASWNYKEKLAGYAERERTHRQVLFAEDSSVYR
ncbi:MAG: hypothetical protein KDF59_02020 [Nitrosomonas sp.]|nr:hypothetical protein [Nitrosomonas sp.]